MRFSAPSWIRYIPALALTLAPCFWQPRIMAGDLSSHVYNAWLAELIHQGRAPGLVLVDQHTNVLFDWILGWLLPRTGASASQKMAVAFAVMIFVSGALALIERFSGRRYLHPLFTVSILAYGYVFRMGFMNFYLSLGLCFWAIALAWRGNARRVRVSAVLLAAGWLAHLLPVLWAVGVMVYVWAWRRLPAKRRAVFFGAALIALATLSLGARAIFLTSWHWKQAMQMTGADQGWIYDRKYMLIMVALLALWGLQFLRLVREKGAAGVAGSAPFQVWAISAALVVIMPTAIQNESVFATFIADRMSLPVGICVVALLAQTRPHGLTLSGPPMVALVFFVFSYLDERALNRIEHSMQRAVSQLSEKRVVSVVRQADTRIEPLRHVVDRICLKQCYSYANYEPSTGEFRVRVSRPNDIVTASYSDSFQMQEGQYSVKIREAPLFAIQLDEQNSAIVRELGPGAVVSGTARRLLPCLLC